MPNRPYDSAPIKVPRFKEENGFYTTPKRSKMMGRIRAKNSKPEQMLRKALWQLGYRYRKNVSTLPGKPDIVMPKYRLAIFVDGEFWHGHNWEKKKAAIKSNREFWILKIERNMQRDLEVNQLLQETGWTVLRFWDKDIKKNIVNCLSYIFKHTENHVAAPEKP